MQIKSLRVKHYKSWCVDESSSCFAIKRFKQIQLFDKLKLKGCDTKTALEAIELTKTTLYRLKSNYSKYGMKGLEKQSTRPLTKRKSTWNRQTQQLVFQIRDKYKLWGKSKIAKVLNRDYGLNISESTVGRILKKLIKLNRIRPVYFYYGRTAKKRVRKFKNHSRRWKYGDKAKKVGELIQLDHMTVSFSQGVTIKEFKAVCPITKITIMKVYTRATSTCAADFLLYLKEKLPFAIKSIQVDGGSEFMDKFEDKCQELEIPLFVLPPRKPKYNGCVERANCTTRYEFYPFYQKRLTVACINKELQKYQSYYNSYRPHAGIELETPLEYYRKMRAS